MGRPFIAVVITSPLLSAPACGGDGSMELELLASFEHASGVTSLRGGPDLAIEEAESAEGIQYTFPADRLDEIIAEMRGPLEDMDGNPDALGEPLITLSASVSWRAACAETRPLPEDCERSFFSAFGERVGYRLVDPGGEDDPLKF